MSANAQIDVLFVCLHGSAKSVVATAYFRRLAAERGLAFSSASAGVEPDLDVSPATVEGLRSDGMDVPILRPNQLTGALLSSSCYVVSFGCDLRPFDYERAAVDWSDVPAVSDGYPEAREVIVARVTALLDGLAQSSS